MRVHRLSRVLLLLLPWTAVAMAGVQPFTAQDLVRLQRVSDPQVSPDGRLVVFVVRETDLEANRGRTHLWLVPLDGREEPRQLTRHPEGESSPRWAPDGRAVYFLSGRTGTAQVWRLPLAAGEPQQVTDYPLEVTTFRVSPDGHRLAVTMEAFPDCQELRCSGDRLAARAKDKATGRTWDQLFVRHWGEWRDGRLATLYTSVLGDDGRAGPAVNLSGPVRGDVPSKPDGGDEEYAFSPDGRRIVFTARLADRTEPWSTNFDLYEVPVDASGPPANLTADNPAWDTQPVFLANGDLAWLAQDRQGFESDRFHVVLRDARTGTTRALTAAWDRSVQRLMASRDGGSLLATADDMGQTPLFAIDARTGAARNLSGEGHVAEFAPAPVGAVVARSTLGAPADLYAVRPGGEPRRLTAVNAQLLATRALGAFESFTFPGWNGETVHGYVVKPAGWAPGGTYPLAFVVHGGPQVSLANQWNYRWNAQAFAGRGYAVVMIDFHGSPGYGQAFTDSITKDWGGKPLEDLQKGLAAAAQRFPWLDTGRACSLGPSYGGWMQYWIAGHWPDGFRCIVAHAGIFDSRAMYYTTEELWFEEWEHGGTYFEHPELFDRFNPEAAVTRFRTPMLITAGQQDFRIPYVQSLGAFTALQRRGIESRLLIFPDENHWILKPANSLQWYGAVLDWLDAHLR